jgi:hypothetical protein
MVYCAPQSLVACAAVVVVVALLCHDGPPPPPRWLAAGWLLAGSQISKLANSQIHVDVLYSCTQ